MKQTLLILLAMLCISAGSCRADPQWIGIWKGGDKANAAIYGNLKIDAATISFSPNRRRWKCPVKYRVEEVGDRFSYPYEDLPFEATMPQHWTYVRLYLITKPCVSQARWIVLAFMPEIAEYAATVKFDGDGEALGGGHFYRVSP